jgi:hypothetical protein
VRVCTQRETGVECSARCVCVPWERQESNAVEGVHPIQGRHSGSIRNLKEASEAKAN